MHMNSEFRYITSTIKKYDGICYIVGSYYRDMIEGYKQSEYFVATNLLANKIKEIFKPYVIEDYSNLLGNIVLDINNVRFEVETFKLNENKFRKEKFKGYTNNIEEDVLTRDFTINAIYVGEDDIIDLKNGIKDINDKIIRTVVEPKISFKQDPLRMLKALCIMSKYDYDIACDVEEAIIFNIDLLKYVNTNIRVKYIKYFIQGKYFIKVFNKYQYIFNALYPEFNKLINIKVNGTIDDNIKLLVEYFNINEKSEFIIDNPLL